MIASTADMQNETREAENTKEASAVQPEASTSQKNIKAAIPITENATDKAFKKNIVFRLII